MTSAVVRIEEQPLDRIRIDGREHPHAFAGTSSERRTSTVSRSRDSLHIESGLDDLFLLKSTGSAFCGFLTDRYTTLKDAPDRILATMLEARWLYGDQGRELERAPLAKSPGLARNVRQSRQPLRAADSVRDGRERSSAAFRRSRSITLTMPNKHRILADLKPFGLENANEIFVATDEPYGLITGTLSRESSPVS